VTQYTVSAFTHAVKVKLKTSQKVRRENWKNGNNNYVELHFCEVTREHIDKQGVGTLLSEQKSISQLLQPFYLLLSQVSISLSTCDVCVVFVCFLYRLRNVRCLIVSSFHFICL